MGDFCGLRPGGAVGGLVLGGAGHAGRAGQVGAGGWEDMVGCCEMSLGLVGYLGG